MRGEVTIEVNGCALAGEWHLPARAPGIVVFAHGSGSGRGSPRNQTVARVLNDAALGTLLLDLLTSDEQRIDDATQSLRFDVQLLGRRLIATIDWLAAQPESAKLRVGLFGASTGAAAALIAAACRPDRVAAIVCRGGRPDLAKSVLHDVRKPVLLLVGSLDGPVIDANRRAAAHLSGPHLLRLIPGASHLFEERGTLEAVARLTRDWFLEHLTTAPPPHQNGTIRQ
jgi:dienelactone hydrolase